MKPEVETTQRTESHLEHRGLVLKHNIKVNHNTDRGCSIATQRTVPPEYGKPKILVLGFEI